VERKVLIEVNVVGPPSDEEVVRDLREALADSGDDLYVQVVGPAAVGARAVVPADWPTWQAVKLDANPVGQARLQLAGPFWTRVAAEEWVSENDARELWSYVQSAAPGQQWRLR
jgi:hypothetical protein